MTPHHLMDLPHAGMAEKQLRNQGDWELTPLEMIDNLKKYIDDVADKADDLQFKMEQDT